MLMYLCQWSAGGLDERRYLPGTYTRDFDARGESMYHRWCALSFDVHRGGGLTYATDMSIILVYTADILEILIHAVNFSVRR